MSHSSQQMLIAEAPSQGNDTFTRVLLHMDGANAGTTFTESAAAGAAHTWTPTTATTSTTQFKFGTTSYTGSATTSRIKTPAHTDFNLGTSDFTIDCWIYRTTGALGAFFAGQTDSTGSNTKSSFDISTFDINADGSNIIVTATVYTSNTSTRVDGDIAGTNIALNAWYHVAFVRIGNNLKLFVNGVQQGSTVAYASSINTSTGSLAVGGLGDYATPAGWPGFIDEFRMSVGTARWTSNFTPPTAAYSA